MARIIPEIRQEVNKSSILLLTEICELMSNCMSVKKSLIDLIVRELDVIQSLVSLLNVDLFGESFDQTAAHLLSFPL